MKRKFIVFIFLFLLTSYFTIGVHGITTDSQVKFDTSASTDTVEFSENIYKGQNSTAVVKVIDQDQNLKPTTIDTAAVKITSDSDSKGFILKMNETGPNTGIFSGSFGFRTNATNSSIKVIKVGSSDNIVAEYNDSVKATAAFQLVEATIETSAENDAGTGNMLDIKINEPDSNNPDRVDTIVAKVGAGSSTNDMTIYLEESGINTGEFEYTVHFTDRETNRKLLFMLDMDKVNIKYVDMTVPQGGTKEILKTISWDYQSTVMTLDKEAYAGYNVSAEVALYNMELNNDSNDIDYVNVYVQTNNSKTLSLQLKETKSSSGKFTGTLYFGRSSDKDENIIKMSGEDCIIISYTNRRNRSDVAECSADWSPQDGQLTMDRQQYSGDSVAVKITLMDWDIAEDFKVKDEVEVTARVPGTKRDRTVTLTETKRDSGIFTETLYINGGGNKNPSIKLEPMNKLEVVYTDEDTTSGEDEERTATATYTGISEAKLTLDNTSYKGYDTYMTISLEDPDYNKSITATERVEVLIKTSNGKTNMKYFLRETGIDTGIFTGSLKLSKGAPNISTICVADTDEIMVLFIDKNVSGKAGFVK